MINPGESTGHKTTGRKHEERIQKDREKTWRKKQGNGKQTSHGECMICSVNKKTMTDLKPWVGQWPNYQTGFTV